MEEPGRLRALAAWYREFAEKTESTRIWEMRLQTAEHLEEEAVRLERRQMRPEALTEVSSS